MTSWASKLYSPHTGSDVVGESKTLAALVEEQVKLRGDLTPKERLYSMYSVDEFGNYSPEISSVGEIGMASFIVGGCVGGFIHSKASYLHWMDNNKATSFTDHLAAKRSLQDAVVKGIFKGGFMWGWRTALFCSAYQTVSSTVAVYRGKYGILEHTFGGCTAGALYKMNMGLRGFTTGLILGGVLGTVAGALSSALCYLTGTEMEHIRFYQHQWKLREEEKKREAIRAAQKKSELDLRDEFVGKNRGLDSVDQNNAS
ncbi:RPII140-upstream gene protein [Neocloeon triangulifer]|uniref:RPII140-upstream gene protein n=1 Tax=Neocloeon triangulifer TaxID=2078957 RepID=UPI00286F0714|nr:RPII140-upstream gene protein [Neocloeon triangulifer]